MSPEYPSLLDTGCDYCFFPTEILPGLGLSAANLPCNSIHAILAEGAACFAWVNLTFAGFEARRIYAGFIESLNGKGAFLLGNTGVLDQFKVSFDPQNDVFVLETYP